MQYDGTTFGIIPDTFQTILSNYLTPLLNTFPNANSPNDPIYTLAYVTASQDLQIQAAMQSLWNAINANTAQGLGLDILASTVLNLQRKSLVPSSCQLSITLNNIYSTCTIQMVVSAVSGSGLKIPNGWTATGGVSTTSPYYYAGIDIPITGTGTYTFTVQSLDTSTPIPASNFTGGDAISGVTFTVTNTQSATLGSVTIPPTFQAYNNTLGISQSPIYQPNESVTYTTAGTYNILVYSQNIVTPMSLGQLNSFTDADSSTASYLSFVRSVSNPYPSFLGSPAETDTQFAARRRYYLNVEGQTYYGMQKAILNVGAPALSSLFIAETVTNTANYSVLIVKLTIVTTSSPQTVVIPNNWTVYGSATPLPNYTTKQAYTLTFNTAGTYTEYLPVYSTDHTTPIGIGTISSADAPYPTVVTAVTNLDPAILGASLVPNGLGERGYTIYLDYPTINPESFCNVVMVVSAISGGPITIPIGWQATGGVSTTSPYATTQTYTISTTGTYTLTVYSTDLTTVVPANNFTGGSSVSGLTFTLTNPTPATLGGKLDTNDPYLQKIAEVAYQYHALGTQFYPADVGATTFTVQTPYPGYTYDVILNPFQTSYATCNLLLVYNSDPGDAGFNNGVFDSSLLPNLKTQILGIINTYFQSKTLPTDLVYTITELSEILQQTFTGIVALVGNAGGIFSFGTISPSSSGQVFLRRPIGYNYVLTDANFNFAYKDKDAP